MNANIKHNTFLVTQISWSSLFLNFFYELFFFLNEIWIFFFKEPLTYQTISPEPKSLFSPLPTIWKLKCGCRVAQGFWYDSLVLLYSGLPLLPVLQCDISQDRIFPMVLVGDRQFLFTVSLFNKHSSYVFDISLITKIFFFVTYTFDGL